MAVSTHELIQSVSVTLLEKLDSVVQGQAQLLWVQHERQITEPTRQIDAPQHLKNADLETKSIQAHTAGTCSCEEARRKTSKQSLQRWSKLPDNFSTTLVEELMTELQEAYSLPDVSPRDVDEFGRNTAHLCITGFGHLLYNSTSSGEAGQLLDGLETLLSFLSKVMHVDIFVGENHNGGKAYYSADGTIRGKCCEPLEMLLSTDCRIFLNTFSNIALEDSSPEGAMLLLQHLKLRRERLRDLAMTHLSKSDLRGLGVTKNELPDTAAAELWDRLQSLYQKGTIRELHDALNPLNPLTQDNPQNEDEVQTIREEEEWDYMLDEGRCLTEELEKLTAEFEQEFISQKVSIEEFLWNHWLKKMREKWKKREPLSKKQKQDLGDIGVDMESDSESDCDLYDPDFDEGESVLPILARGRLMRKKTD
ncbi:hypothetical protein CEP51_015842 [Fusarium floridanum]|uniref:Uncharacterized protein n=1 Tax=Fusarium floridanum TaxID=1325733 RepID=A0A428P1T8_9HYPO|nr:hypothetical protein CEP51_015842 [Fusarium floridanum]